MIPACNVPSHPNISGWTVDMLNYIFTVVIMAAGASAQQSTAAGRQDKAAGGAHIAPEQRHSTSAVKQAGAQRNSTHVAPPPPAKARAAAPPDPPATAMPAVAGMQFPAAKAAPQAINEGQSARSGKKRKATHVHESKEAATGQGRREGTVPEASNVQLDPVLRSPVTGHVPAQDAVGSPTKLQRQGQAVPQAKRTKAKRSFVEGF